MFLVVLKKIVKIPSLRMELDVLDLAFTVLYGLTLQATINFNVMPLSLAKWTSGHLIPGL